jgi:uncharacterized lipoprotein NlpE involved in copper resistance
MKKIIILMMFVVAVGFSLEGCQSQQEKEEAAAREKQKRFWKDATPEKYMEGKEKPKKPYWEN